MFTSLDLLEKGDFFYITVLGEKLAYQVTGIQTVKPDEAEAGNTERKGSCNTDYLYALWDQYPPFICSWKPYRDPGRKRSCIGNTGGKFLEKMGLGSFKYRTSFVAGAAFTSYRKKKD